MSGCDVTSGGCDRSELIRAEYIVCQSQVPAGVYILPSFDAPIDKWCGVMFLRQGQFYRGGIFKFWISFPDNFPESPPQIQFISKVHHPHVHPDTGVVDFGTEFVWNRSCQVHELFPAVKAMLQTPFKSTPSDRIPENFTQQCRECVEESISPPNLYNNHVGFSVQFALYNNRHANFKNLLLQLESEQNLTEQEKAEKLHKAVFDASL